MKHFDQIVVISLPNEVGRERMSVLEPHLKEQGIEYMLFEATENENGVVGLVKTMKELFTMCLDRGLGPVLVLEDDSQFVVPVIPFMDEIWPQLPKDYHCLFLSCTLLSRPTRVSDNILRIGTSYCTNAIVYTLEAMRLILPDLEKNPTQAYDITLMKGIQQENKCFCTFPQMCYQREGYSSIEKKSMDWKAYQTQAFNTYTRGI